MKKRVRLLCLCCCTMIGCKMSAYQANCTLSGNGLRQPAPAVPSHDLLDVDEWKISREGLTADLPSECEPQSHDLILL